MPKYVMFSATVLLICLQFTCATAAVISIHNSFNRADYDIGGPVAWNADSLYLQLTDHTNFTSSRVFTHATYATNYFTTEFDFKIGGGTGADGIVFGWVENDNYGKDSTRGGQIDFETGQANAYGVEIDCYYNSEYHDADGQHIALIHTNASGHLDRYSPANYGILENGVWHHMVVSNRNGLMTIIFDDTLRISYQIADYHSFNGHFGFTAATGGANNYHIIRNVTITQGAPVEGRLHVTAPNGGEHLYADSTTSIAWTDSSGGDHYIVYYSLDNGARFIPIDTVASAQGVYNYHTPWHIPAGLSSVHCLIKVAAYNGANVAGLFDISDANFSLEPIQLISPRFWAGWWLISIPLRQPTPTPANVIGDDIPGIWDFYQFNYHSGYWRPDSAVPGPGYWLAIAHDTCNVDVYGSANTDTVTYTLAKSWNIIGDPFPAPVPLSSILFRLNGVTYTEAAAVDSGLIVPMFTGCTPPTGHFQTTTLNPWFGYWFMSLQEGLEMRIPPPSSTPPDPQRDQEGAYPEEYWQVHLTASSELGIDNIATIGACEAATDSWNASFDFPRPDPRGDYVMVYTEHDNWIEGITRFSSDIRARLNGNTKEYQIFVETSEPASVTLRWPDLADNTTPDFVFTLIDPTNQNEINMADIDHYDLQVRDNPYPLTVRVYGPPLGVENQSAPVARSADLLRAYPNPFNSSVRVTYTLQKAGMAVVTIHDLSGRIVETLFEGEATMGDHFVEWVATDSPAGLYICKVAAGNRIETTKLLLVK